LMRIDETLHRLYKFVEPERDRDLWCPKIAGWRCGLTDARAYKLGRFGFQVMLGSTNTRSCQLGLRHGSTRSARFISPGEVREFLYHSYEL
jgi:hypothetical protein